MSIFLEILPALVRYLLAGISSWLIQQGIITPGQNDQLIAGLSLAVATLGWMIYVKVKDRIKVNTALAMPPGSTVDELKQKIAAGQAASAGTPTSLPPQLPIVLLVAALSGAMLSGCASIPRIAELPVQVEHADRDVKAVTGNLVQLLTMAAQVTNTVSKIEDEASKGGVIPAAADADFDRAMVAYANASDAAANGLVSGATKTWPELRALVQPVLERGQALIDAASKLGAIKSKVHDFLGQLGNVLSAAAGVFLNNLGAFGGGQ
ncbi:MAG: hypothetical protein ABI634_18320 [Acidobacteriota bacterium]